MIDDPHDPTRFSLRRWSRRKLAAARSEGAVRRKSEAAHDRIAAPAVCAADQQAPPGSEVPATPGSLPRVASEDTTAATAAQPTGAALPPLESLTIDSDFAPFLQPGVDENLKRGALRKLFRDPRFNVMDGLDVYIDDYSKPSPMEPELARTLVQARYLFDPPKTRLNEQGYVEDVPEEPVATKTEPVTSPDSGPAPPSATQQGEPDNVAPPPHPPQIS